jgi:addiction module HigA family antidote
LAGPGHFPRGIAAGRVSEGVRPGSSRCCPASGVSLNRLNEIVLGKRGITAVTALRLARLFKMSPRFWMRLQADWDLHVALDREAARAS